MEAIWLGKKLEQEMKKCPGMFHCKQTVQKTTHKLPHWEILRITIWIFMSESWNHSVCVLFECEKWLCNNQASYMDGYMTMLSQKRIQLAKMFIVWNTHCAKVEY